MKAKDIPIPERWPPLVRQAMLHAISLAHFSIICAWSRASDSNLANVNLKAKLDKLQTELSRKNNQLRIIKNRLERVPARHRPYYTPTERMEILAHKAACGWNLKQTAEAFDLEPSTISSWMKRIDDDSLVKTPIPWNKYPSYLKHVVQNLKVLAPRFGKKKIAEYFARSGLYLSATTVSRYLKSEPVNSDTDAAAVAIDEPDKKKKAIISKHPNHIWMMDLSAIPMSDGFWVSWIPNALKQVWPFCWWALVIIDHFSRKSIGFALFKKQPSSEDVTNAVDKAIERVGHAPKYTITDKGKQFYCGHFKAWCASKEIKPRFGAVGKSGSIAVTERSIKSLKDECTRQISVPLNFNEMRLELALYFAWYNEFRPHEYLSGQTPLEVYNNSPPKEYLKLIPASEVPEMKLHISFLEGRKHLPIIELDKAA
jgi:transposase InsO family protein